MKQLLIFITVLSSLFGFGQNDNAIPENWRKYQYDYIVTLTKIDFHVNDTLIPCTLVQEPNGSYSFVEGHQFTEDSVTFDFQLVYHINENQEDTLIPKVVFEKNSTVLELHDFTSHFSTKNGGILHTYDFEFLPYIHELNYSYIFLKTGILPFSEVDNDSIIRLTSYNTSPLNSIKPEIIHYELDMSFSQILRWEYSIDSAQNFELKRKILIPLSERETEQITTLFQDAKNEELRFSTKTSQFNPFLLEFKNNGQVEIIVRSDGADNDERNLNPHDYHSKFQAFVESVNRIGSMSDSKIQKRIRKM